MEFKERIKKLNERKFTCADIINCLIWMTICFIPLVTDLNKEDAFSKPKSGFLITMGSVILIFMTIERGIKLNKATRLYIIFFLIVIISTIFAFDRYQAIHGYWGRWEGLIAFFMYGVMFIATANYFKINKKILNFFIICAMIVAIIAIMQGNGIILFEENWTNQGIQVRSTIGNRNFVSSYLIIFLGITMSSYIFYGKKLNLIYMIIFYTALIFSKTRGGWITLVMMFVLVVILIYRVKVKLKRAIAVMLLFIVIFSICDIVRDGDFTGRMATIKEDIIHFDASSGSGRIAIYKATSIVIKQHPILGMGPDNLWFGIDIYTPKSDEYYWQKQGKAISKAHNEILHIAATLGIPAAIIYIMILFIILKGIWSNIEDDKFKVIFITIIGYIIQANLNISVIDVACVFWVILGVGSNPKIIKKLEIEEA